MSLMVTYLAAELDTLEQYFPLVIGADSVSLDLKRPEEGTKPDSRPIEAREGSRRLPGQKYRVYFGDDLGGEVEPEYELVLRRAAGWVCVDVEDLHPIIEVFERRLLRWWRREGRRKGETPESSSGED
jgi:RNA polymerase I-specific transcription initiation factor RRN7